MAGEVLVIGARPEAVAQVRHEVVRLARMMPFTQEQIEDIEIAIGEAVSNAVIHGSPAGDCCEVTIRCECLTDRFVVRISDEGCGFDPSALSCATPSSLVEAGRGLHVMRSLMDEVDFTFHSGTTVQMVKLLEIERSKGDFAAPNLSH